MELRKDGGDSAQAGLLIDGFALEAVCICAEPTVPFPAGINPWSWARAACSRLSAAGSVPSHLQEPFLLTQGSLKDLGIFQLELLVSPDASACRKLPWYVLLSIFPY